MKILAISGSGRKGRMTHNAIENILKGCKDEKAILEALSLSGISF